MKRLRVGFAGLGLMGSRMAMNLLKKGFPLSVWNRTREKAAPLLMEGATWASSPTELAAQADVLCTCVANPAALQEVAAGFFASQTPGAKLWVELSTVSPALSAELSQKAQARGWDYAEAPVTGSKGGAEAGTLVLMVGASDAAFARAKPIFEAVGEKAIHIGQVGAASQVKLAGNALIASMLQGLSEALLATARAGVDPRKLLEVVGASGFRSPYFDFKGQAMLRRDFSEHFSIDLMFKDLSLFLESQGAQGMPAPATRAAREIYAAAREQGKGGWDICGTVTVLEDASGSKLE